MENFGAAFKNLRITRGYTQKEVAEDVVSVQFLRKFENENNDIRLSNFHRLLNNMNLTYAEFSAECRDENVEFMMDQFTHQIDQLLIENNGVGLKRLIKSFEEKSQTSVGKRYQMLTIILKSIYNSHFALLYDINPEPVTDYLMKVECWGEYEFFPAVYSINLLSSIGCYTISKKALMKTMRNERVKDRKLDFMLQACFKLIDDGHVEQAEDILTLFDEQTSLGEVLHYTIFKLLAKFIRGIILIEKGNPAGVSLCEEIINIFHDFIEFHDYSRVLDKYLSRIVYRNSSSCQQ